MYGTIGAVWRPPCKLHVPLWAIAGVCDCVGLLRTVEVSCIRRRGQEGPQW